MGDRRRYRSRSRSRERERSSGRDHRPPRSQSPPSRDHRHGVRGRDHERSYHDDRVEEKIRKFEERRKQDALDDAQYNYGGQASSSHERPSKESPSLTKLERMEEMKIAPFSRYADDKRLNETLKKDVRWDDPARTFVEDLMPTVQNHRYQPNRFGIPPGPKWDGIDRSNGFEAKYFKAKAAEKVKGNLSYQYSVQNY